jgi:hypothetical protein
MSLQLLAQFQSTLDGHLRIVAKNQRHAVCRWDTDELACGICEPKRFSFAYPGNPAPDNATTPMVMVSLSWSGKNFLGQRFEARITTQRIEQHFDLDEYDIVSVPLLVSFFEQLYRFVLLAESDMDQREIVR